MRLSPLLISATLSYAASSAAFTQVVPPPPQPLLLENTIPPARDIAYPGTMVAEIDARDTARSIFRVKQTIPVAGAGTITLLYPEWLPGNHAPRGPIERLAGIKISGNGKPIEWRRDETNVYAFHMNVPEGVKEIEAEFELLFSIGDRHGRIMITPDMLNIQWEKVTLYPAGYYVRNIPIQASVTLPEGWQAATSLDIAQKSGNRISYQTVDYETLVDSPLFAGRYYRLIPLANDVNLNVFADRPEDLEATPEQIAIHKKLIEQTLRLYGPKHYDEYEFLLALTEELGGIGLEHLQSSENSHPRTYFTEWKNGSAGRDLLAHEMGHSWNGKYRRPAGMWTPDYSTPMRDGLLWVYEGQDQLWGNVLAARSGLMPVEDVKAEFARIAAYYSTIAGRNWRPLADTTNDPTIAARRQQPFLSYQRSEDYYAEGLLIWLDADSIIRERSGGKKSLDDFARAFFGVNPGHVGIFTYRFEDVVKTLNAIVPYDWDGYLRQRVEHTGPAPLDWLQRYGYRLGYSETPPPYFTSREKDRKITDLTYTIGITLKSDGTINFVAWDSLLFNEGVTTGTQIVAVDGRTFAVDDFKAAITAAKNTSEPIRLLVKKDTRYRTIELNYHDGLRYPLLEKIGKGASGLDALLAPK